MNQEEVIRKEALEFYKQEIDNSDRFNAIDDFHEIKRRLNDFYTSESKSIFLDEIKLNMRNDLEGTD